MKVNVLEGLAASGYTFTVPGNEAWILLYGHCIMTTSAVGGNRRLLIEVKDTSNHIVTDIHAGPKQGSSLIKQYSLKSGIGRESAFVDDDVELALTDNLILLPGWTIQILDSANVDAVGDVIQAHLVVKQGNLHMIGL